MDLHLYGPNGLHIYYANRTSNDFELDRDWQSQLGNAVENIYSLNTTIPFGNYTIRVAHYLGDAMNFNFRSILNGSSNNYSGSLNAGDVQTYAFTIR